MTVIAGHKLSCGGGGGCAGSTEEYGFAWAMIYGMANSTAYNYTASTGKACLLGQDGREAVAGVSNFVKLPANDYASLMQAIATVSAEQNRRPGQGTLPLRTTAGCPATASPRTHTWSSGRCPAGRPLLPSGRPLLPLRTCMAAGAPLQVGPISISVDASWGGYEKGVYGGCSKNHTMIDHGECSH